MPATIVVGGQYGSEGKGKVVALLARAVNSPWLVRCGGPNSGHTVTVGGKEIVMRQVPACVDHGQAMFCIAAGCVVSEDILIHELDLLGIPENRIIVDPRCVLVSEEDRLAEAGALGHIGSTCSGTGAALIRRMLRRGDIRLSKDSPALKERCTVGTVAPVLHAALDDGADVIIEGTQGFGLSLLHGPDYPYVTSRDTTAAAFAMEAGLSPHHISNTIVVVRTFPIRVGGTSGPFRGEISWEEVQARSGAPEVFPEFTSVTRRMRRVAMFDLEAVKTACRYNGATGLAVMGLDRIDYKNTAVTEQCKLTTQARDFLERVESATGVPIEIVGTGFQTLDAFQPAAQSHSIHPAHV